MPVGFSLTLTITRACDTRVHSTHYGLSPLAENKKISFKFVDGGTVHSIPWSELLDEQEFPFESFDDITEGLKIFAPWIDDHSTAIRYAEAIVIPFKG